ncbi:MAG: hypothetical protein OXJ37_10020 [Bryobacterales bacterium]|nr:hypothetical protein [Bryobacterales bacterium]
MSEIDYSAVTNVVHQEAQKREALSLLLDELRSKADHHLAIQGYMGEIPSYVTTVPLRWIASKVGFAADLPIFREHKEGSKRIAVDPETIERVQQRQPDWRRQRQMTAYLASRSHHKFPPLLLVAYQHWVYDRDDDHWAPDGIAMCDSLTATGLEPTGTYWDLDDTDTRFYALDGQHRLMAILGLNELIISGTLHSLDQNRQPRKTPPPLSRDDLIKRTQEAGGGAGHSSHESVQRLMDERIGIEIVPAVVNGESFESALSRLRQLFVDVNEHAKTLTPSELAQLDEHHGFRIVARKLMGEHDLLHGTPDPDGLGPVHMKSQTLSEKSPSYTTLHTLSTIVENYLIESGQPPQVSSWRPVFEGIYQRPDDDSLTAGASAMKTYLDCLVKLPSHEAFITGKPAGDIRIGDDNILFRPIAQTALAEAIGKLTLQGASLDAIANTLANKELDGQLKLTDPRTPWFGVLCDPAPPHKMRRHKRNEALCCRLFLYLLGGGISDDKDRDALRDDFRSERLVDEDHAIDLNGDRVRLDEIRLPTPWR